MKTVRELIWDKHMFFEDRDRTFSCYVKLVNNGLVNVVLAKVDIARYQDLGIEHSIGLDRHTEYLELIMEDETIDVNYYNKILDQIKNYYVVG